MILRIGAAARNPDGRRGLSRRVSRHRFAVTTRDAPLRATVSRLFDDDSIDFTALATPRAGNEARPLHDARNSRNTALLSGRTP
jgi:hypothetical protein